MNKASTRKVRHKARSLRCDPLWLLMVAMALDGGSPQQHLVDPSSSRTPKLSLPPKNLSRVEV